VVVHSSGGFALTRSRFSPGTSPCLLNDSQKNEILALLGPLVEAASADAIFLEIEDAIHDCIMWREAGVNAPAATRKRTRTKVSALRNAARRLREAILALDEPAIAVLQFSPGADGMELLGDAPRTPTVPLYSARIDQTWLGIVGRAAAQTEGGAEIALSQVDELIAQSKGGRPPFVAEKRLALRMANLWKSCTGRGVSRQNRDLEGADDGPFPRFLRAVIALTEPPSEIDATWLARDVAGDLAERGENPMECDEDLSTG
jgi:hypothetical protein